MPPGRGILHLRPMNEIGRSSPNRDEGGDGEPQDQRTRVAHHLHQRRRCDDGHRDGRRSPCGRTEAEVRLGLSRLGEHRHVGHLLILGGRDRSILRVLDEVDDCGAEVIVVAQQRRDRGHDEQPEKRTGDADEVHPEADAERCEQWADAERSVHPACPHQSIGDDEDDPHPGERHDGHVDRDADRDEREPCENTARDRDGRHESDPCSERDRSRETEQARRDAGSRTVREAHAQRPPEVRASAADDVVERVVELLADRSTANVADARRGDLPAARHEEGGDDSDEHDLADLGGHRERIRVPDDDTCCGSVQHRTDAPLELQVPGEVGGGATGSELGDRLDDRSVDGAGLAVEVPSDQCESADRDPDAGEGDQQDREPARQAPVQERDCGNCDDGRRSCGAEEREDDARAFEHRHADESQRDDEADDRDAPHRDDDGVLARTRDGVRIIGDDAVHAAAPRWSTRPVLTLGMLAPITGYDRTCGTSSAGKRFLIDAAWAGKPSWSASATIDGAIRRSAASSDWAIAVRFRNASAVMPDETCANPLVGSDAGQPMTKFAALNGVS